MCCNSQQRAQKITAVLKVYQDCGHPVQLNELKVSLHPCIPVTSPGRLSREMEGVIRLIPKLILELCRLGDLQFVIACLTHQTLECKTVYSEAVLKNNVCVKRGYELQKIQVCG